MDAGCMVLLNTKLLLTEECEIPLGAHDNCVYDILTRKIGPHTLFLLIGN
jgi:hypothetical protein